MRPILPIALYGDGSLLFINHVLLHIPYRKHGIGLLQRYSPGYRDVIRSRMRLLLRDRNHPLCNAWHVRE